MADAPPPTVSIGLPVWNGDDYLGEAIDSLLGQSFSDLELIISDNASTDRTEQICRDRALIDPRLRYVRNDTNIGLQANSQRVLELARGRYYMLASHDDLWDGSYVEKMVDQLDRNDHYVIAGSNAASVDEHGAIRARYDNARAFRPGSTFRRAQRFLHGNPRGGQATLIYALMRTELIQRLGLATYDNVRLHNRGKYAWDKRALFRLIFEGRFYITAETMYFHRDVVASTPRRRRRTTREQVGRVRAVLAHAPDLQGYYAELRGVVRRSTLGRAEKLALVLDSFIQEGRYLALWFLSLGRR